MWSTGKHWLSGLAAVVVATSGCDGSPAEPSAGADGIEALALVDWGEAGMPVLHGDHALALEHLFRVAVRQVREAQGDAAARALLERVRPLHEAVRAAALAHDHDAMLSARAARRAELARIVIEVLGEATADRVVDGVAALLDELATKVAEAQAASRPVARLEALLTRAQSLLDEARAASDPAERLDLATQAAASAAHVRFGVHARGVMPALGQLLEQARAKVVDEQGTTTARELFAPLHELEAALRAAREAGDREAAAAALDAVRAEQIRIVVLILGAAPVERALDAAAKLLAEAGERVAHAKAAGHNVSRQEARLQEGAALHAAGAAALEAGDLAEALDLALRAAETALRLLHPSTHG